MAETVLDVHALTSGYGDLAAIREVSLTVGAGEVVALFGPNGAGKSTTLSAIVGVLPTMSGQVRWLGQQRPKSLTRFAREGLAFVPEGRSVISDLSVQDNLRLGSGGVDGAVAYFPELERLLPRPAGLLSGGEQQMLSLGRALATEPRVLLADEVSLGLAPIIVDRLFDAIKRASVDRGLAVLLVEQQPRRALAVADRWYLLRNGEMVGEGVATDASLLDQMYLPSASASPPQR
ncbi:ABC transporter ATP-binding protein [Williamsia sp. 1138]|uniref:ABC transporter ATP-binding protein n=1 Tax=Williamsia sp. 1138 TaxID=1903117 RepID=UPI000A0F5C73|nr:ATP-binding cassette domain-containing protein [Williamsia sp. 1138]OZG26321.1 ABC transporter ATP-binding protein [Williamsia sp. 1138]